MSNTDVVPGRSLLPEIGSANPSYGIGKTATPFVEVLRGIQQGAKVPSHSAM